VLSVKGLDLANHYSASTHQCLKNNGFAFNIIRGYCSYGGIDKNAVANLQAAKSVGFITDVYFFPCRGKSATTQVNEMFSAIPSNLFGMVWLDVESNPSPNCGWYGDNCGFVTELVKAIKAHGKVPGIYSSQYMWTTIMGGRYNCPSLASQQLWYAHYDNNPSFSDFASFGGWTKPNIKQYNGDVTLCGADVDYDYYP
jgi:hypothetical protein